MGEGSAELTKLLFVFSEAQKKPVRRVVGGRSGAGMNISPRRNFIVRDLDDLDDMNTTASFYKEEH